MWKKYDVETQISSDQIYKYFFKKRYILRYIRHETISQQHHLLHLPSMYWKCHDDVE